MNCQNDNEVAMSFSVDVLAGIAIELQSGIGIRTVFNG
jgi:anaerobic nitric oxide reductase transcription regulator